MKVRLIKDPLGHIHSCTNLDQIYALLVVWSVDAWQYGVSWQEYAVGGAALLRRWNCDSSSYEYLIIQEANNKPLEEGGHRLCVEWYTRRFAKENHYEVLWILIVAPPKPDDMAPSYLLNDPDHMYHRTLKGCGYCRTDYNDDLLLYHKTNCYRLITRHTALTSLNIRNSNDKHHHNVGWLLRHYGVPDARWDHNHGLTF